MHVALIYISKYRFVLNVLRSLHEHLSFTNLIFFRKKKIAFQDIRFRKDSSFRFFVGDMIVSQHLKNISYVATKKFYIHPYILKLHST